MALLNLLIYLLMGAAVVYIVATLAYPRPSLLAFILIWPLVLVVLGIVGLWFLYRDLKHMYLSHVNDVRRRK